MQLYTIIKAEVLTNSLDNDSGAVKLKFGCFPKVDSYISVLNKQSLVKGDIVYVRSTIDYSDLLVIGKSFESKHQFQSESCSFDITKDSCVFNDGSSPMVVIEKLTSKLNKLVAEVNKMIMLYNTHTHAVSGSATSATTNIAVAATNFLEEDYKDDKVKH